MFGVTKLVYLGITVKPFGNLFTVQCTMVLLRCLEICFVGDWRVENYQIFVNNIFEVTKDVQFDNILMFEKCNVY